MGPLNPRYVAPYPFTPHELWLRIAPVFKGSPHDIDQTFMQKTLGTGPFRFDPREFGNYYLLDGVDWYITASYAFYDDKHEERGVSFMFTPRFPVGPVADGLCVDVQEIASTLRSEGWVGGGRQGGGTLDGTSYVWDVLGFAKDGATVQVSYEFRDEKDVDHGCAASILMLDLAASRRQQELDDRIRNHRKEE